MNILLLLLASLAVFFIKVHSTFVSQLDVLSFITEVARLFSIKCSSCHRTWIITNGLTSDSENKYYKYWHGNTLTKQDFCTLIKLRRHFSDFIKNVHLIETFWAIPYPGTLSKCCTDKGIISMFISVTRKECLDMALSLFDSITSLSRFTRPIRRPRNN
jgi:hypothetical protein